MLKHLLWADWKKGCCVNQYGSLSFRERRLIVYFDGEDACENFILFNQILDNLQAKIQEMEKYILCLASSHNSVVFFASFCFYRFFRYQLCNREKLYNGNNIILIAWKGKAWWNYSIISYFLFNISQDPLKMLSDRRCLH